MFFAITACQHKDEEAKEAEHTIVVTSAVAKEIVITQQYVCQIHSKNNIDLSARAFGILEEITVKEGQLVKKGDILFKVVPTLYQAKYDAEFAKFRVAEQEYENCKRLAEQSIDGRNPVVSQRELLIYKAKMQEAKSNVDKSQAELNFATIRAPFDGTIDRQEKQQGSTVKEGEILTTLSDNTVMWIYFNVPEKRDLDFGAELTSKNGTNRDTALVSHLNKTAKIELMLANGRKYPLVGQLSAIGAKVNNETGNRRYRADFLNPDRVLCHGRTGSVLISRNVHNAIVIPQRATFEILDKIYVFVVDEEHTVHQREIAILSEKDDIFIIKSGIGTQDKIVLEGIRQVRDGEKLKEFEFRKSEEVLANLKQPAE